MWLIALFLMVVTIFTDRWFERQDKVIANRSFHIGLRFFALSVLLCGVWDIFVGPVGLFTVIAIAIIVECSWNLLVTMTFSNDPEFVRETLKDE